MIKDNWRIIRLDSNSKQTSLLWFRTTSNGHDDSNNNRSAAVQLRPNGHTSRRRRHDIAVWRRSVDNDDPVASSSGHATGRVRWLWHDHNDAYYHRIRCDDGYWRRHGSAESLRNCHSGANFVWWSWYYNWRYWNYHWFWWVWRHNHYNYSTNKYVDVIFLFL